MTAGWLAHAALDDGLRVRIDVGSTRDFVSATLDIRGRMDADTQPQAVMPGARSKIILVSEGGTIALATGGASLTVQPGDVIIIDSDHECRLAAADVRIRAVCLPEAALPGAAPDIPRSLGGAKVLGHSHQPVAIFAAMLANICERQWSSRTARQDMLSMLGHCLSALDRKPAQGLIPQAAMPAPSSSIDAFLLDNLANRALGAKDLAEHLGMSQASVYRRFARSGGAAAYIREFRLDRAFESMLQSRDRHGGLEKIAARHGFSDRSVFSKAFKRRFGFSPKDVTKRHPDAKEIARKAARNAVLATGPGGQEGEPANFHGWMTRNALSAMLAAHESRDAPA